MHLATSAKRIHELHREQTRLRKGRPSGPWQFSALSSNTVQTQKHDEYANEVVSPVDDTRKQESTVGEEYSAEAPSRPRTLPSHEENMGKRPFQPLTFLSDPLPRLSGRAAGEIAGSAIRAEGLPLRIIESGGSARTSCFDAAYKGLSLTIPSTSPTHPPLGRRLIISPSQSPKAAVAHATGEVVTGSLHHSSIHPTSHLTNDQPTCDWDCLGFSACVAFRN